VGQPILLVEDDADTRDSMRRLLELWGYRVLCAADGREALSLLSGELPCLILMDLRMPDMDGWQFRQQLWQEPRLATIPVILISAEDDLHSTAGFTARRCVFSEARRHSPIRGHAAGPWARRLAHGFQTQSTRGGGLSDKAGICLLRTAHSGKNGPKLVKVERLEHVQLKPPSMASVGVQIARLAGSNSACGLIGPVYTQTFAHSKRVHVQVTCLVAFFQTRLTITQLEHHWLTGGIARLVSCAPAA
jgi:CheY-like chemotaxis protein